MSYAVNSDEVEIMENVTLVRTETSNSFKDIMEMRLGVFLATVKYIRLNHLMQNPDWRDAYLKYQYQQAYKTGKIAKQTKIDSDGLLALQSAL